MIKNKSENLPLEEINQEEQNTRKEKDNKNSNINYYEKKNKFKQFQL